MDGVWGSEEVVVSIINKDNIQFQKPTNRRIGTKLWSYTQARACCNENHQRANQANNSNTYKYHNNVARKNTNTAPKNIINHMDRSDNESAR